MYTVNFMDGEDVLFTQQVRHGARVERPASPEKEGYLFAGWYADPELTTAYNFYSAIHADTNIYASWLVEDVYKRQHLLRPEACMHIHV